ncbi:iron reductase [Laetiporus sulphureus 93-53]|uniref:ferric-chelate reductase (NADPH) n=1 Tax=Laetiporus sulphureus 93-53 TaxID=1314785 RepID=A0A165DKX6_9APHY|nr:iron reductase [Laetiporus sulphureus 93-53]KZT05108.1 iron reductase [Laetiporus sulphureus 93-53]
MASTGTAPTIPTEFQQYNSYVTDPKWQRKFSIIWASFAAAAFVLSLPHFLRALRRKQLFRGFFGVSEDLRGKRYTYIASNEKEPSHGRRTYYAVAETIQGLFWWDFPYVGLSLGQALLVAGYLACAITCMTLHVPLITNPNRAGFLALAQFPVVFLFATKNSVLSLLLGPGNGYERLNFLHRWAGRGMLIGGLLHGALWIRNHLVYDIPIIGQQKETSGVAALGVLCILALTSLRLVRRYLYEFFFITHVLGYVAFTITICYHTTYAYTWIYAPLAFYGLDMFLRLLRYRIKDATLVPVDGGMTLIHVHDCVEGWQPGQHVRLRVFFSGRFFESHPLTIINAPSSLSCAQTPTLALSARVRGDWTRALNRYAMKERDRLGKSEKDGQPGVAVQVMLDGPYGGCGVDLGRYECAFLIAGGSGASFTLSLLDDIVARCVKLGRSGGEKTTRVEFVWYIPSTECAEWFYLMLTEIVEVTDGTSLDLHISIFITRPCKLETSVTIPKADITVSRPSVGSLMRDFLYNANNAKDIEDVSASSHSQAESGSIGSGGGVAICAAGPDSLMVETRNAAAMLSVSRGIALGWIGLHTESFAL